jgi:S1-C subfamily serine protease
VTPSEQLSDGTAGLGFAIPIDTVKAVVAQLIHGGKVDDAYLGISAIALSPGLARDFDLPTSRGLLVQGVEVGSGAGRSGLRAGSSQVVVAGESYRLGGDIIVSANGSPVATAAQLRDVLTKLAPGDTLRLELWRGNNRETVTVRLGRPPG